MPTASDQAPNPSLDIEAPVNIAPSRFVWIGNLVFVLALFIFAYYWGDWDKFIELVTQMKLAWLGLALLLQLMTYLCVAATWQAVLRSFGIATPIHTLLTLSIAQLFMDQVLPSFGLSGSIVVMKGFIRRSGSASAAAAAVIINTISRYAVYFLLFTIALGIIWKDHDLNFGLESLAITFSLVLVLSVCIVIYLLWLGLKNQTPQWLRRFRVFAWFLRAIGEIPKETLRNARLWLISGACSSGVFLLDAGTLWATLWALGAHTISFPQVFASYMVSSVIATVAVVPGGFGFFEGSSIATLHFFNVPLKQAIAATILLRGFTYWLPMLPGFLLVRRELHKK